MLDELFRGSDTEGDGALLEGAVASSPDADGRVYVIVPTLGDTRRHGPCPVMPKGGSMPPEGARCLVADDEHGGLWVVAWDGDFVLGGGDVEPQRVTSLPVLPSDGQEVYFVADDANGVLWHLRYNAGSSSPYKWERVGGPGIRAYDATRVFVGGDGFLYDPATGNTKTDLKLTLPLAGEYRVTVEAMLTNDTTGQTCLASYDVGATAYSEAWGDYHYPPVANQKKRARAAASHTVAAGTVLTYRGGPSGSGIQYHSYRALLAEPVRVG